MNDLNPHPAAPLTPLTQPHYEQIAALRVDGWTQCRETRHKIAELTARIWKEARNGNSGQCNAVNEG